MPRLAPAAMIFACLILVIAEPAFAADEPRPESYLTSGKLIDGEKALSQRLTKHPKDDTLRFALGAVQFIRALEHLGQNLHRYGLRDQNWVGIPILRLPFGKNPHPEALTYEKSRAIVATWIGELQVAEATLAEIRDGNIALPVAVDKIQLDIAGETGKPVPLMEVLARIGLAPGDATSLFVRFDRADVAWLRAYCHLLSALGEVVLAHDERELFNSTAQLFFTRVDSPLAQYFRPRSSEPREFWDTLPDLIAFVHLIRFPVAEPARMKSALAHLQQMVVLSREMWKFALAETDNDHEWIPNPKQKGPFGIVITQPMLDGWMTFLDEAEALFQGKRLVPFWRNSTKGINLRRVFTEPRTLDVVLWAQGTAAVPYLEEGPHTKADVWNRLVRVFQGDFVRFFAWIN